MSIFLYILIVLFAVLQSASTKLYGKTGGNAYAFNAIKASAAFFLFALFSLWNFSFHPATLLYGAAYGISLTISMFAGYKALLAGPLALTSMLVSFSVIIPLFYGILFLDETLTLPKTLGLFGLFATILLVGMSKKQGGGKKSPLWLVFVFLTFAANGICSVLQSAHQTRFPGEYTKEFMLCAMLFCSLFFAVCAILQTRGKACVTFRGAGYGVLSGAANGISNYATLMLAGMENASVLFPAVSVGTILGGLVCGFLLFKEKPHVIHLFALVFGIAAVVLLKI